MAHAFDPFGLISSRNDEFDAWNRFRAGEVCDNQAPLCHHCGRECSGDTTESVNVDGMFGEVAVCDEPETCGESNPREDIDPLGLLSGRRPGRSSK